MRRVFFDRYGLRPWAMIMAFILGIGLIILTVAVVGYNVDSRACIRKGHRLERDTQYDFFGGGCYIRLNDGRYIPLSNYRVGLEDR